MKWIKVGAAVLNQTPLDWLRNQRRILHAIRQAKEQGVGLLCLPELCITGHGCEDAFQAPGVQATALEILGEVAEECQGIAVAFGLPLLYRKALFDVVALVADGRLAGFVAKRNLAGDGLYYEPRWFKPWPRGLQGEVEALGQTVPIGDLHFSLGGIKVGFEICEDAWVGQRPGIRLATRGVDVILNPSASHFAFGKHAIRRRFVLEGSRAFGVGYAYANLLGNEAGRSIYDGGALVASGGRMLAEGPRFSFEESHVTSAVIDVDANRMLQSRVSGFMPELEPEPGEEVEVPFVLPEAEPESRDLDSVERPAWQQGEHRKKEEFTRAVSLGLYDYLRKSRSRGFVVSLSGGADSSAVSCLVALMVKLGLAELGAGKILAKLRHIDNLPEGQGALDGLKAEELVSRLLLCAYQSTRNSSEATRESARTVAEAIGAEFLELDVDGLVAGYEERIEGALGRPLSWETDDLARQNIQARVRSPSIWMLANIRGSLLLSTSNRSEAAVGYATMDGDTSGGLSPIAGIDKAFLRQWLRWLETVGPEGCGPMPALGVVNALEPTAELRPGSAGQTDEQDLMPYPLLDAIERAAIRDKQMPLGIYRLLRAQRPELDPDQLVAWIERFFRLWCRNQWKRERYAPSFHVDDQNLDPKTWCRFPILSGGFERELAELRSFRAEED